MGLARERPFQALEHAAELGVAADQGRAQAERLEPSGFARGVEWTIEARRPFPSQIPGYSISQRAHKPQGIEIAGELLASCMPL